MADDMVIATGTSDRHLNALALSVAETLKEHGAAVFGIEGQSQSSWIVVDAGDVIIHLFTEEARDKYQLEKMWSIRFTSDEE